MNNKLKFATIGTSWITSSFIEAALITGNWELGYVYSRDKAKAEALINKFRPEGVGAALDDLDELARRRLDVVYIASPNSLHCGQALFFLERGVHVVCEKPAAVSEGEWESMERASEKSGAYIIEAFRHINSPGFDALRKAASSVGLIRNAIFSYNQYSSKYDSFLRGELPNVFNPKFAGGAMNDLGIYPISLAAALWGGPEKVHYAPYMLPGAADGAGAMVLDYSGFMCAISFSKIADGFAESEILGEDGNVVFDKPQDLTKIYLCPRNKNAAPKTKISDYGKNNAERIDMSVQMAENNMTHEAEVFADIIMNKNDARYKELIGISRDTHRIMGMARSGVNK